MKFWNYTRHSRNQGHHTVTTKYHSDGLNLDCCFFFLNCVHFWLSLQIYFFLGSRRGDISSQRKQHWYTLSTVSWLGFKCADNCPCLLTILQAWTNSPNPHHLETDLNEIIILYFSRKCLLSCQVESRVSHPHCSTILRLNNLSPAPPSMLGLLWVLHLNINDK